MYRVIFTCEWGVFSCINRRTLIVNYRTFVFFFPRMTDLSGPPYVPFGLESFVRMYRPTRKSLLALGARFLLGFVRLPTLCSVDVRVLSLIFSVTKGSKTQKN